jgi:hypothetical protein
MMTDSGPTFILRAPSQARNSLTEHSVYEELDCSLVQVICFPLVNFNMKSY